MDLLFDENLSFNLTLLCEPLKILWVSTELSLSIEPNYWIEFFELDNLNLLNNYYFSVRFALSWVLRLLNLNTELLIFWISTFFMLGCFWIIGFDLYGLELIFLFKINESGFGCTGFEIVCRSCSKLAVVSLFSSSSFYSCSFSSYIFYNKCWLIVLPILLTFGCWEHVFYIWFSF